MTKKQLVIFLMFIAGASTARAMVADNRYFPWYALPYERTVEKRSMIKAGGFFEIASSAYGTDANEHIGISEIWGPFDQRQMSDALIIVGQTSPLFAQWQLQKNIAWTIGGKTQAEGMYLRGEFALPNGFSIGGSTGFMHCSASQAFVVPKVTINDMNLLPAQIEELDRERRVMLAQLGFNSAQWSKTGMTDTVIYGRYGTVKDYIMKCRRIDLGVFAGALIPTGVKRDPNVPASVPFGGNGHAGYFVGAEGLFEIKEDWLAGLKLQLNKRVSKTQNLRMSVNFEPIIFGATSGAVEVDPGVTFLFNPTFAINDLRDGWGGQVDYFYAHHAGDVWTDMRTDKSIPVTLNVMNSAMVRLPLYEKTRWTAEYIALTVFYDSDRITEEERVNPFLVFSWYIPLKFLGAENVSKTNSIELGFEFHF